MATVNDPVMALAPNYMGSQFGNAGVEMISANYGLGLGALTNDQTKEAPSRNTATGADRVRNAAARQFGKTKENVF